MIADSSQKLLELKESLQNLGLLEYNILAENEDMDLSDVVTLLSMAFHEVKQNDIKSKIEFMLVARGIPLHDGAVELMRQFVIWFVNLQ